MRQRKTWAKEWRGKAPNSTEEKSAFVFGIRPEKLRGWWMEQLEHLEYHHHCAASRITLVSPSTVSLAVSLLGIFLILPLLCVPFSFQSILSNLNIRASVLIQRNSIQFELDLSQRIFIEKTQFKYWIFEKIYIFELFGFAAWTFYEV